MSALKLAALDKDDLRIVSAHVQDAVLKIGEIDYSARGKRLILPLNRFAWEAATTSRRAPGERRRSVLHFDRVLAVKTLGIDRSKPEDVLSVLAITFIEGAAPAGAVEIVFAGEAAMLVEVECVEARLTDLGSAWEARGRPRHGV